jgi:aryl-alcohol dehydrogenase-like predicted oxidoreductase
VVPTFGRLKREGKVRFSGITAVGDTAAIRAAIRSGKFDSAQIVFNVLNPSAAVHVPSHTPDQDYGLLMCKDAEAQGVGVIGIRVLAGGALSGSTERHEIASSAPNPIASSDYNTDVQRAQWLLPLVEEGFVESLAEASIRFAISPSSMGIILVGTASPEHSMRRWRR